MSNDAINLVCELETKLPSSVKAILFNLANSANKQTWLVFLSVETLVKRTGLDRKTVIKGMEKLRQLGLIVDTGERVGRTRRVVKYRLILSALNHDRELGNSPNNGIVPNQEPSPIRFQTVPNLQANSTEISNKSSQNRDAEPLSNLSNPLSNPHAENEFKKFCAFYPRKINKRAALTAFDNAIQEGIISSALIDGAKAYAETVRETEQRFIKCPANWLKDYRWQDLQIDDSSNLKPLVTLDPSIVEELKKNGFSGGDIANWFNDVIFDRENNCIFYPTFFKRDRASEKWLEKLRVIYGDNLQLKVSDKKP